METTEGVSRSGGERYGGGITYDKQDWRRVPTERFRLMVTDVMGKMDKKLLPDEKREWFDNHYMEIKDYPTMNPVAMLFGLACISWETKEMEPKLFRRVQDFFDHHKMWVRQAGIQLVDVIRYGRYWTREIKNQDK